MTTDDRLLKLVDKLTRARKATRSAFIRDALEAEIRRQRTREEEARNAEGYARKSVAPGEFDVCDSAAQLLAGEAGRLRPSSALARTS